jgi:cell division septal protein FtsQ
MASHTNSTLKYGADSFFPQTMQFRRKNVNPKRKKIKRKIRLKLIHILFILFLFLGIFFLIQRLYLFLISWNKLNVKTIEIYCQKPEVTEDIKDFLRDKELGNILLLNIDQLKWKIASHRWIKDVHVRKIFPSSIRIGIEERIPAAILKTDSLYIIDKQGVLLREINSNDDIRLPVLIDSKGFKKDFQEKIQLAWECLEDLSPEERKKIAMLDMSEFNNVSLKFNNSSTWFVFGNDRFSEKLQFYKKANLEKFGPLEKVDLRFKDRLYIKPLKKQSKMGIPSKMEEAN